MHACMHACAHTHVCMHTSAQNNFFRIVRTSFLTIQALVGNLEFCTEADCSGLPDSGYCYG